jgi:hypothetical protein
VSGDLGWVRLLKRDERDGSTSYQGSDDRAAVSIKKFDTEEQIVFGEVYAPGFPDSQGDYKSAEEVKKMAYNFMRKGITSNIDVNHTQEQFGAYVAESFIARDDDPVFIPGSWVVGVKVSDPAVWHMVKSGELNGFSLDGHGFREDKVFTIEIPNVLKGDTDVVGNHRHEFTVKFDDDGNFLGGQTDRGPDGHQHQILRGTVTEMAAGHTHRFSFVEGVMNVSN